MTSVFSSAYLPPIEYFIRVLQHSALNIELFETYSKQSYRNRCSILTANGVLDLCIPVTKPQGNHTLTRDIKPQYTKDWQQTHWRTIESAYRASPYFLYYQDDLKPHYKTKANTLVEWNQALLDTLFDLIGIHLQINYTTEYIKPEDNFADYRNSIHPKKQSAIASFLPKYIQVFETKHGFHPNLSILDLLFNEGPNTLSILNHSIINL